MTIGQFMGRELRQRGVPEQDALSILAHARTHPLTEHLHWESETEGLPHGTLAAGFASLQTVAREWVGVYRPGVPYLAALGAVPPAKEPANA